MPDLYMHSRVCEDVIKELKEDINEQIAFVGAQGPDPLYYAVLSKQSGTFRMYADRMHDTDTKTYLKEMVRYVKQHYNKENYSYLVGFLCHYALDVSVHPYVYHHVGIYKKADKSTHAYRGLHMKFERSIDACIMKKEQTIKPHRLKLIDKYYPLKKLDPSIYQFMGHILNQKFKIDNGPDVIETAYDSMYNVVKHIHTDTTGLKKLLYKFIDLFTPSRDMFMQDLSFFKHIENYDFLNTEKRIWSHPVTNQQYDSSVMELYDQGKNFAIDLITKVNMYLSGSKAIDLNNVFTNLSLNSGIDCDHEGPFQYFNIYRK